MEKSIKTSIFHYGIFQFRVILKNKLKINLFLLLRGPRVVDGLGRLKWLNCLQWFHTVRTCFHQGCVVVVVVVNADLVFRT